MTAAGDKACGGHHDGLAAIEKEQCLSLGCGWASLVLLNQETDSN